jgi:hypothetical protein
MNEGFVIPTSRDLSLTLALYASGFMRGQDKNHLNFWVKIRNVDANIGIIADAVMLEGSFTWVHFSKDEEKVFNPEGVRLEREGLLFRMFGGWSVNEKGTLTQTYTPYKRDGKPISEKDFFINHFYLPDSHEVPEDIICLYYGI